MATKARSLPGTASGERGRWSGFFINLDRARQRREHMEAQLASLGISSHYKRHPAADGRALKAARNSPRKPGEIGIYQSHMAILEAARGGSRAVHVMEDDIILSDLTVPVIDVATRWRLLDHFDIVFSEIFVGRTVNLIRQFHRLYEQATAHGTLTIERPDQIKIIDLTNIYLYGATSYVVGPRSIGRVLAVLNDEWKKGPTIPIDTAFQFAARAGRLRLGCFFPFVTTVDFELSQASSAGRDEKADDALVQRVLRYSFFVRRNIRKVALPAIRAVLERENSSDPDGAIELYTNILKYHVSKEHGSIF